MNYKDLDKETKRKVRRRMRRLGYQAPYPEKELQKVIEAIGDNCRKARVRDCLIPDNPPIWEGTGPKPTDYLAQRRARQARLEQAMRQAGIWGSSQQSAEVRLNNSIGALQKKLQKS